MFGCLVAGRPVETNLQTVTPGKYLITLDQGSLLANHLAIFLTGERLFEAGYGASIFASFDMGNSWKYLGVLANEKPSAFFRLSGAAPSSSPASAMQDSALASNATIGISIEPVSVLEQLMMEHSSQALIPIGHSTAPIGSGSPGPLQIAQRVGEHLFNYIESFGRAAREVDPECQVVPLKTVQDWFAALIRRATIDPDGFARKFTV